MRRLVLTADLSFDGFAAADGLDAEWAREYDDDELARYQRRVVLKAGIHAHERDWSVDAIAASKADGGDEELAPIVAEGGPEFCQELTRRGLVDEFRIVVHPVVLGQGHRVFAAHERLYLISSRLFASGSMAHAYVPVRLYRDRPPPLPWALPGSERAGEDDDDPQAHDTTESPAPG